MQAFEQAWCEFCCREPNPSSSDGSVRLLLDQPGGTASYGQCVDTFSVAGWTLLVTVQLDGSVALWATACLRQRRRFFWDASNERLVDDQVNVAQSITASGSILSVRFRSPDAALIVGTRAGHVICIEHDWSTGRPRLYGRWRLLGQLAAPVWLVGASAAPAALTNQSAQAAESSANRSSAPSPSPVDSSIVIVAWTKRTLWWQTTTDGMWQSCSLLDDLPRDLNQRGDDAATAMYIGECAPSGRFFAWTYRHATVCWIHARPGTEAQPPEKVFRISSREPLYSLCWKPAPIRGCDALLLGDLRGRLMLFRPDLESTEEFVAVATTPPISETKIPLAGFVHQYAAGGIAEDEEDAAWTILTAWRLASTRPAETTTCSRASPPETIRSPNVHANMQELGPMVHPRRISHAVHFVGQFTGDDTFLWRVSHLNDEPFPRAVHIHPPTELAQKLEEHLVTPEHHHEGASCPSRDSATTSHAVSLALRIEAADPSRLQVSAHCAPAKALRSPRPPTIPSQLNWFLQQGQTLTRWYQNGRPGDGLSLWSHAIVLGQERSTPFASLFYSPERQSLAALTTANQLVWWPLPSWPALSTGYAFRWPRLDGLSIQSPLQWLLSAPCLVSGPSPHRRDELAFLTMSNGGMLSVFAWPELSPAKLATDEVAHPVLSNADATSRPAPSPYPCMHRVQAAAFACVLVAHVPPGVTVSTCSVWSQPRSGEILECPPVVGLLCWSTTLMEWSLGTIQAAEADELPEHKSMSATTSANMGKLPAAQREQGPQYSAEMPSSEPWDGCIGAAEKPSSSLSATMTPVTDTTPRPYRVSSWQRVVCRAAPPRLFSIRTDKVFVWRMDGVLAVYQLRVNELLLQRIAEVPSALSLAPEQTHTARYRMIVSADAEELAIWDSTARCLHFWSFDGATIYKVTSVEMPSARPDPDISFAQYNGQSYAVVDNQLLRRVAAHWFHCGDVPTSAHHVVALPEGFLGCSRHDHLFVLDVRAVLEAGRSRRAPRARESPV
ncbi:Dmx-like 1 [Cyanidiococcus yangmingshanensis]|uniref:Dmx-like 1 n=1 Tax=Cyanidiococcus yangmingshanensis TaxID=2690220 RepID=A0A7J7IIK9_9RHOD|nr:Dmx-like 1 [Cyanidiococcus yangmingshanensis]